MKITKEKYTKDGLQNLVTGLGTGRSKNSANEFVMDLLNNWYQLDSAYQSNWIASNIVDIPASDMTREWRTIKCKDAEIIETVEQQLCIQQNVETAIKWARLYGGCGLVMMTNQDLTKPLNINKITKGSLVKVLPFDRWDLIGQDINMYDPLSENYLQPNFYTLIGGSQQIHHSHIVKFYGKLLPRRYQVQVQGWGDSLLRRTIQDVMQTVAAKEGIAELMQEANVDVISVKDLANDLSSDQEDAIMKRYALFSQMKSNIQMGIMDESESYSRKTLSLGGVAPIIEQLMTWISGAAGIPVTKLFGTSAKGMNATGEGDLNNYYDTIRSLQNSHLSLSMRTLDEVLVRSALGSVPTDFDYIWNPLHQQNELEISQTKKTNADRDIEYLNAGIITKSQIMTNLQSDETYQFEQNQIDEMRELEDQTLFEDLPEQTETTDSISGTFVSVSLDSETRKKIYDHLINIGIEDPIKADDLHVTLMYSKNSFVMGLPESERNHFGEFINTPGIMGNEPYRALYLPVDSWELQNRHNELKLQGGVHSYDEFKPHLSLKYQPTIDDLKKLKENPLPIEFVIFSDEKFITMENK